MGFCEVFLSSNLPTYHSSPPSLENSYKILILFSFLSPTPKLILPPLLKKLVATNTLKIELKLFFSGKKESLPKIQVRLLKRG
jgi:hypothetical protein